MSSIGSRIRKRLRQITKYDPENTNIQLGDLLGSDSLFAFLRTLQNVDLQNASQLWDDKSQLDINVIDSDSVERTVEVPLVGTTDAKGRAEFEVELDDGVLKQEFKIRINNAAPNTTFSILIDGVKVGDVLTDASGRGEVKYSTQPGAGEVPFPADFPFATIKVGTVISIDSLVSGQVGTSFPQGDDSYEDALDHESKFKANLTGGGARGEFEFEVETEVDGDVKLKMKIDVRGLAANSEQSIFVNEIEVGKVTINGSGRGKVLFETFPESGELPIPGNLPTIAKGTTVRVGALLKGTVGTPTVVNGGGTGPRPQDFKAVLAGTPGMKGQAEFEVEPEDGVVEQKFVVKVLGGSANALLKVKVNGVEVGEVLLNATGAGKLTLSNIPDQVDELPMPSIFPDISSGAIVQVGNVLSGTLQKVAGESFRLALPSNSPYSEKMLASNRNAAEQWLAKEQYQNWLANS